MRGWGRSIISRPPIDNSDIRCVEENKSTGSICVLYSCRQEDLHLLCLPYRRRKDNMIEQSVLRSNAKGLTLGDSILRASSATTDAHKPVVIVAGCTAWPHSQLSLSCLVKYLSDRKKVYSFEKKRRKLIRTNGLEVMLILLLEVIFHNYISIICTIIIS